jgi:hypothetical protein
MIVMSNYQPTYKIEISYFRWRCWVGVGAIRDLHGERGMRHRVGQYEDAAFHLRRPRVGKSLIITCGTLHDFVKPTEWCCAAPPRRMENGKANPLPVNSTVASMTNNALHSAPQKPSIHADEQGHERERKQDGNTNPMSPHSPILWAVPRLVSALESPVFQKPVRSEPKSLLFVVLVGLLHSSS